MEEEEEEETAQEALARQHRRERKDLQGKIQSMKNAIPKNDKRRRKQLAEEVARLEAGVCQRHREEVARLEATGDQSKVEEVVNGVEDLGVEREEEEEEEEEDAKLSRTTKAQKRRDKKAALARERERRIAVAAVENHSGLRHQERLALARALAPRQLQIRDVPSDGHCLYRAVEDQLAQRGEVEGGGALGLVELRHLTAQHMRNHQDNFLPFLTNTTTGDMFTPEEFEKYCSDVAETAVWGGQLELTALSQVLQLPLQVLQADCPPLTIGEEFTQPPITLIYMRHAYGLGEHYNSVERLNNTATEEES